MIQCPTVSGRKPRSDVVNILEGEVREREVGGGRVKGGGEKREKRGEGEEREKWGTHTHAPHPQFPVACRLSDDLPPPCCREEVRNQLNQTVGYRIAVSDRCRVKGQCTTKSQTIFKL